MPQDHEIWFQMRACWIYPTPRLIANLRVEASSPVLQDPCSGTPNPYTRKGTARMPGPVKELSLIRHQLADADRMIAAGWRFPAQAKLLQVVASKLWT